MGEAGDAAYPGGQLKSPWCGRWAEPSPGSSSRPAAIEIVAVCVHPGLPKADAKAGSGTHEISQAMAVRKNVAAARGGSGSCEPGRQVRAGATPFITIVAVDVVVLLISSRLPGSGQTRVESPRKRPTGLWEQQ